MYIEVISVVKKIISDTNRSEQVKKESRHVTSYIYPIQTQIQRHRREFVEVNSFIFPVTSEARISENQTLSKHENRNIASYVRHMSSYATAQTTQKKENIHIYAHATVYENISTTHVAEHRSYAHSIENPSFTEVT
ncbi:hypothetical protein GGR02_003018 [Anoxybacillus voinovskiensis]|uniref:Uncharacterized protein n=1 Tax=Anoxybacteroides voinovskiense TaxID=230470 RepID=A0A840DPX3_9BACL|nr:hypothetical protein [Anoxybacillus voinovskiensis]MBB4075201.1 hypothetical protein [Anoxybacillus voinovskiensis]GGJ77102.1 hypothetical protein GCM10008982_28060 [Anoxybacillus voinovskiensis]